MVTVLPLVPGILSQLAPSAAEIAIRPLLSDAVFDLSNSWQALMDDKPIAAGGFIDLGHGVALAWAVLTPVPYRPLRALLVRCRNGLATAPYYWIEAHVRPSLADARHWVKALGFEPIGSLSLNGQDFTRYVYKRSPINGR